MLVTAWKLPRTVVAPGWTNPNNIKVVDGNFASKATSGGQGTGEIRGEDFGFTTDDIPPGSTIVGIEVRGAISFSGPADAESSSLFVQVTGGVNVGTNKASSWSPVSGTRTAGGAADAWSAGVTAAQAISSAFAVAWNALNTSEDSPTTVFIGSIELRFHFIPPPVVTAKQSSIGQWLRRFRRSR